MVLKSVDKMVESTAEQMVQTKDVNLVEWLVVKKATNLAESTVEPMAVKLVAKMATKKVESMAAKTAAK